MKYLILLIILTSCSTQYHCRRCLNGSQIKIDSTKQKIKVPVPESSADSTLDFTVTKEDSLAWNQWTGIVPKDTITIFKDRTQVKVKFLPGEKIYIKGICLSDTIIKEVDKGLGIEVNNGIPPFKAWTYGIGAVILALLVGAVIGKLIR